jgi:hypothetical protein
MNHESSELTEVELSARVAPAEAPTRCHSQLEQLEAALASAKATRERMAFVLVEVCPHYVARAAERMERALEAWRRPRCEHVAVAALDADRYALLVAPVGSHTHARELADDFVRELDPRVCSVLRRALPYARCGVSLYPDDGVSAAQLLERAERSAAASRNSVARARKLFLTRGRARAVAVRALSASCSEVA